MHIIIIITMLDVRLTRCDDGNPRVQGGTIVTVKRKSLSHGTTPRRKLARPVNHGTWIHDTQVYFRPCTSGSCAPVRRYGKTMKSKEAEPSRVEFMVPADRSH